MRTLYLTFLVLVLAAATPILAAEPDPELFFTGGSDQSIGLRRFDKPLDSRANECSASGPCKDLYTIQYVGTEVAQSSVKTPDVLRAHVDPNIDVLALDLSGPISLTQAGVTLPLSAFHLVLLRAQLQGNPKPSRFDLALAPTFFIDPDSNTDSLIYRGIHVRKKPLGQVGVTAKDSETKATIVYDSASVTVTPYPRESGEGNLLWRIKLSPKPPRGKPLEIAVLGIDDFQGTAITRGEKITFVPFPKGRDDAKFYLKGQKVYNYKGDDQGSIDFKSERPFFSPKKGQEWWHLVSATVGSKDLKISQTGTASVGYRRWLGVDPTDFTKNAEWNISFAPTFRTDRDFKNRDLGLDVALAGEPAVLYYPIERRRKMAATPQQAERIATGWWIKPKFSIEAGKHLASSADSVEGEIFARGVGGLSLMWETDRASLFDRLSSLKLTVDFAARYLSKDEVTLDKDSVLKIENGYKPYLRAELAYDLGFAGLSVVHENGKLPPAFKKARATTVGLTFKF